MRCTWRVWAKQQNISIAESEVRTIIVAGEPGGSAPATRERIESAWGAELVDHAGATEIGPWGYGNNRGTGLHVVESEFIAEFLSMHTGQPTNESELSELVLTTLGRHGARSFDIEPVIWFFPCAAKSPPTSSCFWKVASWDVWTT